MALSIASIIALAGDTISIADNAFMMIHDPWTIALGTAEDFIKTAEVLNKIKDTLVNTYVSHTNMKQEEVLAKMAAETWFTAKEAVDAGLATQIKETVKIAASFDFSMFKNAPSPLLQMISEEKTKENTELENKVTIETDPKQSVWKVNLLKRELEIIGL